MIVLDTNVFAELMKGSGGAVTVQEWARRLPERPVTTAVTRAEVLAGLALMPEGKRRDQRRRDAEGLFEAMPGELVFEAHAADRYAAVVATRTRAGRPISVADAMIAAICLAAGASLATRNIKDFAGLGLVVINPWEAGGVG